MLSRRLVDSLVHQLSIVWHDLGGVTFSVEEIDIHNDASTIASVVRADLRRDDRVPDGHALGRARAADPVGRDRSGRRPDRRARARRARASSPTPASIRALAAAPVTIRAEVASRGPSGRGHPLAGARQRDPARRARRRRHLAVRRERPPGACRSQAPTAPRRAIQIRRSRRGGSIQWPLTSRSAKR